MIITYHGHAEFAMELSDGTVLITDPYDAHVGYAMKEHPADAVTVSHGHGDHAYTDKIKGEYVLVHEPGLWHLTHDASVEAIPSVHDEVGGAKRGKNLIMKIMAEGLTLVHLGDQGDDLTEEQVSKIGRPDVLMIPVGGFYTVDAAMARHIVDRLQPRVVIPMHYKTEVNQDWPIADEKPFLQLMGKENLLPLPLLRITKGDLSQQPAVVLLQHR